MAPTLNLYIDIETYASVDLRKTGVYSYVEDPTFRVLLVGYAIETGEVRIDD